jgi:hypothetical protein
VAKRAADLHGRRRLDVDGRSERMLAKEHAKAERKRRARPRNGKSPTGRIGSWTIQCTLDDPTEVFPNPHSRRRLSCPGRAPVCVRLTHVPLRKAIAWPLSLIRYPGWCPCTVSISKGPNSQGWCVSLACLMTFRIAARFGSTIMAASIGAAPVHVSNNPLFFDLFMRTAKSSIATSPLTGVFLHSLGRNLWLPPLHRVGSHLHAFCNTALRSRS